LQCAAVCCSVLQYVAVWFAVRCSVLQRVAAYCNVLCCAIDLPLRCVLQRVAVCCSVLQCVAVHHGLTAEVCCSVVCCSVLHCTLKPVVSYIYVGDAVYCILLQRVAACCSVGQCGQYGATWVRITRVGVCVHVYLSVCLCLGLFACVYMCVYI